MPAFACPVPGCDYMTADLDTAIVAALITANKTTHSHGAMAAVKADRVSAQSLPLLARAKIGNRLYPNGRITSKQPKSPTVTELSNSWSHSRKTSHDQQAAA
ncbi:hypothetical protein ElyMa_003543400 [Elysia marginata]|uniref:Uncharacterized protein n=1 Tax=Elysia marginata TaxID=1093978 RepID=A0AAV4EK92_9GAST|nr:hypothetical protein ElyMa_003543400 [Elysia marginata]